MKTRKLRYMSETPGRYGTIEIAKGDVIDVPAGVASQLVKDDDWTFADVDAAAAPDSSVQTSAPTTSRRPKSGTDS